jgi:ABC-type nitrate/sulfonate/bicarbonate transport system substrate-binding protein
MGRLRPKTRQLSTLSISVGVVLGLLGIGTAPIAWSTSSLASSENYLKVSPGTDIPKVSVKFGITPFADSSTFVIAIREGWFNDVGISIAPEPAGLQVTADNVIQKVQTGDADVVTAYAPGLVQALGHIHNVQMFGFEDAFIGSYILANPKSGATPIADLLKQGVPLEEAVKRDFAGLKGARLAISNTGQRRDFVESYFKLAGLKVSDVKMEALPDAQIVALARGGQIDYAAPEGAAQVAQLLKEGWVKLATITDLVNGLPPGDPRGVLTIGHDGPAATTKFLTEKRETALRFLSVMFRTIDAITENPETSAAKQVPYLNSVTGLKQTAADLAATQSTLFVFPTFEQQSAWWTDAASPQNYAAVYGAQITSAKKAGVIPADSAVLPDDMIIGRDLYEQMVALRSAYDKFVAEIGQPSGASAELAGLAKKQYDARNYLDAYRLMKAAVEKGK